MTPAAVRCDKMKRMESAAIMRKFQGNINPVRKKINGLVHRHRH